MNRENYTRITTILYPFSGLDQIDPTVVQRAGFRGTKVHKICEAIVEGLGELGVDEESFPYVESFKQWWSKGHDVVAMEKRFYDDKNQITGQSDLILKSDSGLVIVDLKTSHSPSKTWQIQGCAYAYLAKSDGFDIKSIQFLHLSKKGKEPKIHEYAVDDDLFLSVFKTWKHFYKEKKND